MLGPHGGEARNDNTASGSFYSGHTSAAFTVAVFTGMVYDAAHPGSSYSTAVWAGALGAATLMGVLRVAAGKHYPSDVVVGAVMGSLVGWLVPTLHKTNAESPGQATSGQARMLAVPRGIGIGFSF
jgi:membrane-associated phospholipid phosphatase